MKKIKIIAKAHAALVLTIAIGLFSVATAEPMPIMKSMSDVYPVYPVVAAEGPQADAIKRGEYLVKTGDCIACHTNMEDGGKPFSGGLPFDTPFGIFYSTNISPDKETGIGSWTVDNFINAMQHGISPSGSNYFPVFPYLYFNKMKESDLRDIFAYLQAIPAVKKENKTNEVPFPLNVRFAQYGWKTMFFYWNSGPLEDDPSQSAAWNRGRYLVDGPGHCGMCHTPLNPLGGPKRAYYLTGGFVDGYWAPNITGEGLKSATPEEIVHVFKSNRLLNNAGEVAGGMAEVNHNSLSLLSDEDLLAIATYLKSVTSEQPMGLAPSDAAPTLARGEQVYFASCAACHAEGQAGAPVIGDASNWFNRVQARGKDAFYKNAINGYNNMPIRGGCVTCSDNDVTAAVDYLLHESLTHAQALTLTPAPEHAATKPEKRTGEAIYTEHCAVCHDKQHGGALSLTNTTAWTALLSSKTMDVLYQNTITGTANMPPKGGCKMCSNADVINAVKYMVEKGTGKSDKHLW